MLTLRIFGQIWPHRDCHQFHRLLFSPHLWQRCLQEWTRPVISLWNRSTDLRYMGRWPGSKCRHARSATILKTHAVQSECGYFWSPQTKAAPASPLWFSNVKGLHPSLPYPLWRSAKHRSPCKQRIYHAHSIGGQNLISSISTPLQCSSIMFK